MWVPKIISLYILCALCISLIAPDATPRIQRSHNVSFSQLAYGTAQAPATYHSSTRHSRGSAVRLLGCMVGTVENILITSRTREAFPRSFSWIHNLSVIINKSGGKFNVEQFLYKQYFSFVRASTIARITLYYFERTAGALNFLRYSTTIALPTSTAGYLLPVVIPTIANSCHTSFLRGPD